MLWLLHLSGRVCAGFQTGIGCWGVFKWVLSVVNALGERELCCWVGRAPHCGAKLSWSLEKHWDAKHNHPLWCVRAQWVWFSTKGITGTAFPMEFCLLHKNLNLCTGTTPQPPSPSCPARISALKMEKFIHERWAPFHRGNLVNCSDTSELPYRTTEALEWRQLCSLLKFCLSLTWTQL